MIEKRIFYLWCGSEKPVDVECCVLSWHRQLPDYEIVEIREDDTTWFDFAEACQENEFFNFVYKNKIWAYVADYVRFYVLEKFGGIWLDTDVQVLKNFDDLLDCGAFMGRENNEHIETAVIGAEAHHQLLKDALDFYDDAIWHSPLYTSPRILTFCLTKYGFVAGKTGIQNLKDIRIYTPEYFYPLPLNTKFEAAMITDDTYSVHWWKGSWSRPEVIEWLKNKNKSSKEKSIKVDLQQYFCLYLFGFLKFGKFLKNSGWIKICGLPLLQIKQKKNKKTAKLLGFIPLLKWK